MNLSDKNTILEALRAGYPVKSVCIAARAEADSRVREIAAAARSLGVPVLDMQAQGGKRGEPPPAVSAVTGDFKYTDIYDMMAGAGERPLFLALDHVQGPRNLGAVFRTTAGSGAKGGILETRRCCEGAGGAVGTCCGGAARVPVARVSNLANTLETMKKGNVWIVGADERAEMPAHENDFAIATCLVLGSEGEGLSRLVRDRCDFLVRIPTDPVFPSLNVSVAAGVLLFEARRQRIAAKTK
jgi:23S rRNA (guanosine2251-2'-O)-methyltransferase